MSASATVPVRTVSETNQREHWAMRHHRRAVQRSLVRMVLGAGCTRPAFPCVVTLTRIAPRSLDDDNLRGALKAVRDGVADWLGVDDADPRIEWRYDQRRGRPREHAVRIDSQGVEELDSAAPRSASCAP